MKLAASSDNHIFLPPAYLDTLLGIHPITSMCPSYTTKPEEDNFRSPDLRTLGG